jgi:UDP-3-O-acyl-N-acetylglucosamine deacetylase
MNNKLLRALTADATAFETVTFEDEQSAPSGVRYQPVPA